MLGQPRTSNRLRHLSASGCPQYQIVRCGSSKGGAAFSVRIFRRGAFGYLRPEFEQENRTFL